MKPILTSPIHPGLTAGETKVLDNLAAAWNAFVTLPEKDQDRIDEFRHAIRSAQYLIAFRVAKRIDPWAWWEAEGGVK